MVNVTSLRFFRGRRESREAQRQADKEREQQVADALRVEKDLVSAGHYDPLAEEKILFSQKGKIAMANVAPLSPSSATGPPAGTLPLDRTSLRLSLGDHGGLQKSSPKRLIATPGRLSSPIVLGGSTGVGTGGVERRLGNLEEGPGATPLDLSTLQAQLGVKETRSVGAVPTSPTASTTVEVRGQGAGTPSPAAPKAQVELQMESPSPTVGAGRTPSGRHVLVDPLNTVVEDTVV